MSDSHKVEAHRFYRDLEPTLAAPSVLARSRGSRHCIRKSRTGARTRWGQLTVDWPVRSSIACLDRINFRATKGSDELGSR
jgi:hypothetical protein